MSNKILITNNTDRDVLFVGAQIKPGVTREYFSYALHTLASDAEFLIGVNNGDFTVNNGTENLSSEEASVYLSSLTNGANVNSIKSSLGYISTGVVSAPAQLVYTVNPLQANTWILTITDDVEIQLSPVIGVNVPIMSFDVTIKQDAIGFHKVTMPTGSTVTWAGNRMMQVPLNPNGTLTVNFSSTDNGASWSAKEVYRSDVAPDTNTEMFDSDNLRRQINNTPSSIGVQIVSQSNIETALLSYSMLANSSASTVAELQITVDGIVRHTAQTPSFYQDQLVTQDVLVDSTWQIGVGSVITVLFRETSGALLIEVKGDVQNSTMLITNIVEGEPVAIIGVTSTDDTLVTTAPTRFGLNWSNNTGDGFLSGDALLAFNIVGAASVPVNVSVAVDGVSRYTASSSVLTAENQRITFDAVIDESWQVNTDSVIEAFCSIPAALDGVSITGSVARSELLFANIVSGTPNTGPEAIEGINVNNVVLSAGVTTPVITVSSSPLAITVGEMSYSLSMSSNFASSCVVSVTVDTVEKYARTWTGISASNVFTDTVPVTGSWGIVEGSEIILTCREGSGNPAVEVTVNGETSASTLTIVSTL
jgi:hypothetical protein